MIAQTGCTDAERLSKIVAVAACLLLSAAVWSCVDDEMKVQSNDGGEELEVECTSAETECGEDTCADLNSDRDHCGECGNACDGGEVCSRGECELSCAGGLVECDGICRDTETDRNHCGECGNACDEGEVCSQGTCDLSCGGGLTECDEICRDTDTDRNHCGSCGNDCADGEVCSGGTCQTSCGGGLTECDGICRDTETDRNHCGGCATECADGEVCSQGSCELSCGEGLVECDEICRDTETDANHCGSCANECADGEVCVGGECETSCGEGLTECDGTCRDLETDRNHCGGCDDGCAPSYACAAGECTATPEYPETLPGLSMWLRADSGVVTDGGGVTSWHDRVDSDRAVIQSDPDAMPGHQVGVVGGASAVAFDGATDSMSNDDFSYPRDEFTKTFVFVPGETMDASSGETRLFSGGAEPYVAFNQNGDGTIAMNLEVDNASMAPVATETDRWASCKPYVLSFRYDGEVVDVYVDGEHETSADVTGELTEQIGFELGAAGGAHHTAKQLAEMMIFDEGLSDDDLESVHHYAFSRYRMYFDGAPWVDTYPNELRDEIVSLGLSYMEIESQRFCGIGPMTSCDDHRQAGRFIDGQYPIEPGGAAGKIDVYCDMTTDDGGWTLVAGAAEGGTDWTWDNREYLTTDRTTLGSLDLLDESAMTLADNYKNLGLHDVSMEDVKIRWATSSDGLWASYHGVGNGSESVADIIDDTPVSACHSHNEGYEMAAGTFDGQLQTGSESGYCGTRLYFNLKDLDGSTSRCGTGPRSDSTNAHDTYGPSFNFRNNNGSCGDGTDNPFDEPSWTGFGPEYANDDHDNQVGVVSDTGNAFTYLGIGDDERTFLMYVR